ncbi:uncharacterized protein TNCV_3615251 [Trichonephila clavipes]|nr:uncharacterized protein TNCV_3615251 [Trichonephila clavipes]
MYNAFVAWGYLIAVPLIAVKSQVRCLVKWVEGEKGWEAPDNAQGILLLSWGGTEINHSVTCMVLKATANNMSYLALCHDEFRGPSSGLCRSGGISNKSNKPLEIGYPDPPLSG